MTRHKRVWIYCRTANLDPDMKALEIQKEHLMTYAKEHELTIGGITAEHGNGVDISRKGLEEVFNAIETDKAEYVLVKNWDRLVRGLEKAYICMARLRQHHAGVICADGSMSPGCEEIMYKLMRAVSNPKARLP